MEHYTTPCFTRRHSILINFGSDELCHVAVGLGALFCEHAADRNELRYLTHQFIVSRDSDECCCLLSSAILVARDFESPFIS